MAGAVGAANAWHRRVLDRRCREADARLAECRAELRSAADEASKAMRAKDEFLAVMSHEIRTPLNAVIGGADLLAETRLDNRQADLVDTIRLSSDLLLSLLNDILDFSKIESGKFQLESIPFDVELEVEAVCRTVEDVARQRGLRLSVRVDEEIDLVVGDPLRWRQVLLNLVSNALKFTAEGGVAVRVGIDEECEGGGVMLRCEVEDTGIGIGEEIRRNLFRAFEQGDVSTTRRFGGTGLGLAICRQLCELMGGAIGVESTPGEGSTFWFVVRLDRPTEMQRLEVLQDSGLKGRCILVLSGDDGLAVTVTHFLMSRGCEVGLLSPLRAREVVDALQCEGWDAIITDEEALQVGGTAWRGLRTPVIALGVDDVAPPLRSLPLPLRKTSLIRVVQDACGRRAKSGPERPVVARHHVLVVEDNAVNRRVVSAMLEQVGCSVSLASDGLEAVECASKEAFDLILMDFQMPLLDGPGAARRIREQERERGGTRVPIVALTANSTAGLREACAAAGMDDFLTKPVRKDALSAMVEKWATSSASAEPSP